jgi:prepilin-type N-terminal cleavage/methylation domain-containing protein
MRGVRQRAEGFTLPEILTVVAVIASLAVPPCLKSVYKSRRDEALQALRAISMAQTAYLAAHDVYGDTFDEIGFALAGGRRVDERTIRGPVYTYTLTALEVDGKPRGNYRAIASGNLDPTDDMLDVLMIENQLTVLDD